MTLYGWMQVLQKIKFDRVTSKLKIFFVALKLRPKYKINNIENSSNFRLSLLIYMVLDSRITKNDFLLWNHHIELDFLSNLYPIIRCYQTIILSGLSKFQCQWAYSWNRMNKALKRVLEFATNSEPFLGFRREKKPINEPIHKRLQRVC